MKIGIYASIDAGHVHDLNIDYIGVDQGVKHLLDQGIQPCVAIGDMDSIENVALLKNIKKYQFPAQKDDTDTALAIKYAIEQGYHDIDLYGVTQKRMDHFIAALKLLQQYDDYHIVIYDQYNKIQILKSGNHVVQKDGYQYFSVFAIEDGYISLNDCHYPLERYFLRCNDPLCVSNQMNHQQALIENEKTVLLIQSL